MESRTNVSQGRRFFFIHILKITEIRKELKKWLRCRGEVKTVVKPDKALLQLQSLRGLRRAAADSSGAGGAAGSSNLRAAAAAAAAAAALLLLLRRSEEV